MQNEETVYDPFNWTYFLVALVVLVSIPLMHVILGWFAFYL